MSKQSNLFRIGIDVGGTFTDFVAIDGSGRVTIAKSPSTPADQSVGVLEGLRVLAEEMGLTRAELLRSTEQIVHGTTAATNALLERRGAKTGMLTTKGHRDVIEQREGLKPERYNLRLVPQPALVPRNLRLGVPERIRADGSIYEPLDEDALRANIARLAAENVEAVAICYLHAYANASHEERTREILKEMMPGAYVCLSSEVLGEIKEYERFSTTVVNAFVGTELKRYFSNLERSLAEAGYSKDVLVMHSHGGVGTIEDSVRLAASCVLSGPAGGTAAASYIAHILDEENLVSFDMGGTSTDIALLEKGEVPISGDRDVDGLCVALPSIDIYTIGSGGGSIAYLDEGGILHVGPVSAGADPGPASYGKGGTRATVTDANATLGYFDAQNFLGGRVAFAGDAAERAVGDIASKMGCSIPDAAEGIQRIVNTQMAEGVRVTAVRRGMDLRQFTLISFGGAAGLHIADMARMLNVKTVIVPGVASVLSAWGMLATDLRYELSRSFMAPIRSMNAEALRSAFAELEVLGRQKLARLNPAEVDIRRRVDMRYGEQVFEISTPLDSLDLERGDLLDEIEARFHERHEEVYTYKSLMQEVIMVNIRVSAIGRLDQMKPGVAAPTEPVSAAVGIRKIYHGGHWQEVPVYQLESLAVGKTFDGPALIETRTTTVALREGDQARINRLGWVEIAIDAVSRESEAVSGERLAKQM